MQRLISEDASKKILEPSSGRLEVREVRCSSLLHLMNYGPKLEYTINLYRGCSHGCNYCYAPSLIHDERQWGTYVDAKINAPQVLEREIRKVEKKRVVFISSASDPYQPVEAKYRLTRRVLEILRKHDFPVLVLTRSPLILRDLDILKEFSWVRVGFSISSVPTKSFEPGVPPLEKRLETLAKLSKEGITTWVSMAPVIPQIILSDIDCLFKKIKEAGVSTVTVGMLRFIGYEESRLMFESRSGWSASEASLGESEIREKVMKVAESYGVDTTGSCLGWDGMSMGQKLGADRSSSPATLESFFAG